VNTAVFAGTRQKTPLYDRETLPSGVELKGPVIIGEAGSTTVIPPDFTANVDEHGNIVIRRMQS